MKDVHFTARVLLRENKNTFALRSSHYARYANYKSREACLIVYVYVMLCRMARRTAIADPRRDRAVVKTNRQHACRAAVATPNVGYNPPPTTYGAGGLDPQH